MRSLSYDVTENFMTNSIVNKFSMVVLTIIETHCLSLLLFFFESSSYRGQNVCGGTLTRLELVGFRVT